MNARLAKRPWMWLGLSLVLLPQWSMAAPPGKVRLFILSGQSNMARFEPDASFTPALKKAFPRDEVIVVKSAQGGQPIRRWYKGWKAPASAAQSPKLRGDRPGDLYDTLIKEVKSAVGAKKVDSVAFVWMQGERDAKEQLAQVYAESLRGLIGQLRADLKRPDMVVVIGRLSDHLKGNKQWDAIRAAQEQVAEADPLARWVDTDDLNGPKNDLHLDKAGYEELGRRYAARVVELLSK